MTLKEYSVITTYLELRDGTFYPYTNKEEANPWYKEPIEVCRVKLVGSMSIINAFKKDLVHELVEEAINNLHSFIDQLSNPTEKKMNDPLIFLNEGKWLICKEIRRCISPLFTYKKIDELHLGFSSMPNREDYAQTLKDWINEYQGKEYDKYFDFLADISNLLQRIDHDHPNLHP